LAALVSIRDVVKREDLRVPPIMIMNRQLDVVFKRMGRTDNQKEKTMPSRIRVKYIYIIYTKSHLSSIFKIN